MKSKALRIGLIGSGDDSSSKLLRLLVEQGMQVVHALMPNELTDQHIAASDLDVWLLDLDDSHWHSQLDELMDRSSVPIFFNEHKSIEGQQHLDYWCRNLIGRMFELVADVPGLPPVAPAPAAAAAATRGNETLHIAFPQKTESKPSDELNVPPTALDPELLQEIEELEQLLHSQRSSTGQALADLDEALPLPAQTVAPAPAPAPAPAAKEKKASTAASAPAVDADPVAAAKARAAKIQQQVAAQKASQAETPTASASKPSLAPAPAMPAATAPESVTPVSSTPTPAKPAPGKSEPAKTEPAKPAAASTPAPQPTAPATPAMPTVEAATAASNVSAPKAPAATVPKSAASATSNPATSAATTAVAPAAPTVAKTASLDTVLAEAAATPVVPPPEKHDWPSFPLPPSAAGETEAADAADFAPMQPQPAAGPMRDVAKPSPVHLVRTAPAATAPATPAATAAAAAPTAAAPTTAAAPRSTATPPPLFSEPVPTLTATGDQELEFEAVDFDFEPHTDPHEHPEFDVPMLESVVVASDFEAVAESHPILPCDLWVLGASLGGPAALKRFFTALNQPLPICFLLAQHIDAHFLPVLGKILEQANPFYPVQVLVRPGLIEPGTLLLAPIEKRLRFLDAGQIVQGGKTWTPPYSPCIDDVLTDVAAAYPGQVHAIVFSGMGEDGVNGANAVHGCHGEVWVQDADSCASSVMPDAIDKAGLARYRASPEELAARLMARYNPAVSGQSLA